MADYLLHLLHENGQTKMFQASVATTIPVIAEYELYD